MSSFPRSLLCASWVALLALGFSHAWRYESTAGNPGGETSGFPSTSRVRLAATLPTVAMFAHPNCPCTLASLDQLATLVRKKPSRARVYVLIVQAPGLSRDLTKSDTATAARRIEGAIVLPDPSGVEAKRFGAATSGQVVVFDPRGTQRFRGGITESRGHPSPNDGLDAVASILDSKPPEVHSTPVFGCSLLGDRS